ncbi:hypothetical protein DPMN_017123 [Dreissena polymorpha]|uniref:Uncharacterized protein n=1 Tax=Dreissena polymorpha TaxID=45954 RepID=A0A9D4NE46_DREPO|nr:hypothetical protein DPMN_017123 [Dreissena polymorpha]
MCRTDGKTDGQRQNNIPPPMAGVPTSPPCLIIMDDFSSYLIIMDNFSPYHIIMDNFSNNLIIMDVVQVYILDLKGPSLSATPPYVMLPRRSWASSRNSPQLLQPQATWSLEIRNRQNINILTKFRKDWMKTATSIVYTRMMKMTSTVYTHKLLTDRRTDGHRTSHNHISSLCHFVTGNTPPPGGHVFQATGTIFELVQDIIGTNLLTMFHDDRTLSMASRVLRWKCAMPPWRPYIIGTNLLTKFHEDRKINVASRVLTRKNAPPLGGYVFQPMGIIFSSSIF